MSVPGLAPTRRHRRSWWLPATVAVVAVVVAGTTALVVTRQVERPLPDPVLRSSLAASLTVPGSAPGLPWPSQGQGAVQVPSLGVSASFGPDAPAPIASLTKLATAVVVLRDHPVAPGAPGPSITIGPADVAVYETDAHTDQSTVAVQLGEVLSERQVLEGLLTQSANNLATTLAVWDAGSVPAFVAKMNALAGLLGMTSTHYADASGYDQTSVSSAVDVLKMAAVGMRIPTFAEVVGRASVTLPVVGTVPNIVTQIGTHGVIGIKSGFTSFAGGCMVLAAEPVVAGRPVLVLDAVIGQPTPPPIVPPTTTTTTAPGSPPTTAPPATSPTTTTTIPLGDLTVPDPLKYAGPAASKLLSAVEASVVPVTVATRGSVVGSAAVTWGGVVHRVPVATSATARLPAWPGRSVTVVHALAVAPGTRQGTTVGAVHYALGGQEVTVGLHVVRTVPEPSWWWRLTHHL